MSNRKLNKGVSIEVQCSCLLCVLFNDIIISSIFPISPPKPHLAEKAQEIVISYCQSAATQHVRIASIDVCSDEATLAAQLDQVEADGGPIYMLINCAGTAVCGTVEDTSVKTARHLMDVNFFGTFGPTRHVLAGMQRRQQGGIVVLTSSLAGVVGVYGMGAYCAAKFALRGFAESLALENAHRDISVTVALPGDTDTPGFAVENETKPRITKLMSESGGLVHPRAMGKQIVEDALVSLRRRNCRVKSLVFIRFSFPHISSADTFSPSTITPPFWWPRCAPACRRMAASCRRCSACAFSGR